MGKFTSKTASEAGKKSSRQGSGNKNLEPIRTAFRQFVEKNLDKVQANFDNLSDKDKLYFILNMAEYCIPKLQRTELTGEDGGAIAVEGFNYIIPNASDNSTNA